MKLPSKVTSYKKSIFPLLPKLLELLSEKDYSVTRLYDKVSNDMTVNEFIDALDCLFILEKITMSQEVIHYVERNTF